MKAKILFILLLCCVLSRAFCEPTELYTFKTVKDQQLFSSLTKEIRCVVCQNQNIADSNAPLANDLREKVYQFVLAQRSEAEIKDYLVQRYGEFILLKPSVSVHTSLLWLFPFLALLSVVLIIFCYHRKMY